MGVFRSSDHCRSVARGRQKSHNIVFWKLGVIGGKITRMFEVIEIGAAKKKWLFGIKRVPVKMKATTAMSCELLGRTFQGHGNYTTQRYRADFSEGDVITVRVPSSDMIAVGDRRSAESLAGQGLLKSYFRLVGTNG
jgi:hypothetical protein